MRSKLALAVVAALFLSGCFGGAEEPPSARPTPGEPARREALPEPRLRVENVAFGESKRRLRLAIRDLKRLGFWDDLTRHLYVVRLASRLGRAEVPDDGHLADAFLRAQVDERGRGAACDIMFFPRAMRDDLESWRSYHARGLMAEEPPTLRQLWAAILAHELAHCLTGHKDKRGIPQAAPEWVADKWEARILEAFRRR